MTGQASLLSRLAARICHRIGLAKVPLCLFIGCSTLFGYILADPVAGPGAFYTGLAIFVLATGAATLNSLQEYRLDGQLDRTKDRPLPKGLLALNQAFMQSAILLLSGLITLYAATREFLPVLAAVFAVVLYNGVYTPLKKKSVLAIVPGALCGALPAYIGWLGGGGAVVSYPAALLTVLFILWQVPHFWLVLLTFKEDYHRSSLPSLLKQFQEESLKRFFVTWVGALVTIMLMFLTLQPPFDWPVQVLIGTNGCLLLVVFVYGLAIHKTCNYRMLFRALNMALFLHMMFVAAGRVMA